MSNKMVEWKSIGEKHGITDITKCFKTGTQQKNSTKNWKQLKDIHEASDRDGGIGIMLLLNNCSSYISEISSGQGK